MIKLDQVQLLESRVEKAVERIAELSRENASLKTKLAEIVRKNADLEELVQLFEEDQTRIEQGILKALNRLSEVEDSVFQTAGTQAQPQTPQNAAPVQPVPQREVPVQAHVPVQPAPQPQSQAAPQEQPDFVPAEAEEADIAPIEPLFVSEEEETIEQTPPAQNNGQFDIF